MDADNTDRNGKNVQEGEPAEKPWKEQSNGVHPGFSLGPTEYSGVQEDSDGRGRHILGAEENQGKLKGVRGGEWRCPLSSTIWI